MTLKEIIASCENYDEFSIVYARKTNAKFEKNSEAVVLVLTEEEMCKKTTEVSIEKCPGFDYFLEMFLIQEMFVELKEHEAWSDDSKKVDRIIQYAENDS